MSQRERKSLGLGIFPPPYHEISHTVVLVLCPNRASRDASEEKFRVPKGRRAAAPQSRSHPRKRTHLGPLVSMGDPQAFGLLFDVRFPTKGTLRGKLGLDSPEVSPRQPGPHSFRPESGVLTGPWYAARAYLYGINLPWKHNGLVDKGLGAPEVAMW